jgi:FMN phosphatase YigB (HAD superfamily)
MKYVALDIGNVLCHVDSKPFINNLSKTLNITLDEAGYFLHRTQKLHDLGYTVISDELRDHFKIKSQLIIDDLVKSWTNIVVPCLPVLEAFNKLTESHNLKVALLSNIGLEHAGMMEDILSHGDFFKNSIKHFSCYVGVRKPSFIYYQSFLMQYPEFKGCLYLDDLDENLRMGKTLGFDTFKFELDEYKFVENPYRFHETLENISNIIKNN